jgi:hypothetical protein
MKHTLFSLFAAVLMLTSPSSRGAEIILEGGRFGQSVELWLGERMASQCYLPESGKASITADPGDYRVVIRPGMVASFDEETLVARTVSVSAAKPTSVKLDLPRELLEIRIQNPQLRSQQVVLRLDGLSGDAKGVRRWFTMTKDAQGWLVPADTIPPGGYRVLCFDSIKSTRTNDFAAAIKVIIPQESKRRRLVINFDSAISK